jgi:hypothetical protein
MSYTTKQLLSRRKKAINIKQNWQDLLQQAYRYSQPNRNVFEMRSISNPSRAMDITGQNQNWYVYDTTLSHATEVYANKQINALTPAGKKWLRFVPGTDLSDLGTAEKDEIRSQFDKNTDTFFKFLHASNFQTAVYESTMDAVVSTGIMVLNKTLDPKNPCVFTSVAPDVSFVDEGVYGDLDFFVLDYNDISLIEAQQTWPGFVAPSDLVLDADKEPCLKVTYIACKNYSTGLWDYTVIDLTSGSEHVCWKKSHKAQFIIGWRIKKLSGEVYGRGPAIDAMPSAATINQAVGDEIVSNNFRALPTYMGFDDGIFNPHKFKIKPLTILPCSPTTTGVWPLAPVPVAGDLNYSLIMLNELREQVQKIMLVDPFGAVENPNMTATEIIARQQQILEHGFASFSRIQREFFKPLVASYIEILREFGHWDDVSLDGNIMDVEFETPLMTSQGLEDVLMFMRYVGNIQQTFGDMYLTTLRPEKIVPWMADKMKINAELVNTEQQQQQIGEIGVQQMMQQMGG